MFLRKTLFLTAFIASIFSNSFAADLAEVGAGDGKVVGVNALMSAATDNDIEGVKFFSKSDKALIDQRNLGGATALHLAARQGNFEIVEILIQAGANPNITDNEGWTPLMRAALAGNPQIVKLLISNGADVTKRNSIGESVIINAANSKCFECLSAIFENSGFAERMEDKLLKQQLSDAFTISRNREDKKSQDLLETYLNSVIKGDDVVIPTVVPATAVMDNKGKKLFKFVPEDSAKVSEKPWPDVAKTLANTKPIKRYIYNPMKDESGTEDKEIFSLKEAGDEVKPTIIHKPKHKGPTYKFKPKEDKMVAKPVLPAAPIPAPKETIVKDVPAPIPAPKKLPEKVVAPIVKNDVVAKPQEAVKQPELKSAIIPPAKPVANIQAQAVEQKIDDNKMKPKFVIGVSK